MDPPPQGVHLTPTAQRGPSPDLIPLASTDQNQVHPGEGQCLNPLLGESQCLILLPGEGQCPDPLPGKSHGLIVQVTTVTADINLGHTLPSPTGETGTVYIAGLEV